MKTKQKNKWMYRDDRSEKICYALQGVGCAQVRIERIVRTLLLIEYDRKCLMIYNKQFSCIVDVFHEIKLTIMIVYPIIYRETTMKIKNTIK